MPYVKVADVKYLLQTKSNRELVDDFEYDGHIEAVDKLLWDLKSKAERFEYENMYAQKMEQQLSGLSSLVNYLVGWCESRGMEKVSIDRYTDMVETARKTVNDYKFEWREKMMEDAKKWSEGDD